MKKQAESKNDDGFYQKVKEEFTSYMVAKGHRKTPERYLILKHIYSLSDHFDIDFLFHSINAEKPVVSRATLYNTIELLVDSKLVIKHSFGTHTAHYEKAYNNDNHLHLICTVCGEIKEIKDHDIKSVIQSKRLSKFSLTHYSLYIYGMCTKCSRAKIRPPKEISSKKK